MVMNAKKAPAEFVEKTSSLAEHPLSVKGKPHLISPEKKLRRYVNK
jgi:hypothetical protein